LSRIILRMRKPDEIGDVAFARKFLWDYLVSFSQRGQSLTSTALRENLWWLRAESKKPQGLAAVAEIGAEIRCRLLRSIETFEAETEWAGVSFQDVEEGDGLMFVDRRLTELIRREPQSVLLHSACVRRCRWRIPARLAKAYPSANESISLRKVVIVEGSATPSTRNCR
jgi:hypothetical protein